ncbi:hypothetical protein DL766_005686 [Monosporascus sp. MC13-8B]|nr:hypothetical protein DL763_001320 [Monosporascus cannonballus]RYP28772.1 hypothetical protein DL766_005686 [Monosporascus sp. MC13-8B]
MSEHTYKFNVTMSCGGCSGAINRVLGKLEGEFASCPSRPSRPSFVPASPDYDSPPPRPSRSLRVKSYDVSLEKQEALVVAEPSLDYETVLRTIKKTGKKVNSGEADGEAKSVELAE